MRILIVEDDHRVAEQAKRTLEAANFVVDLAHDGEEGHFLGDTESYDAVVLDLGPLRLDTTTHRLTMSGAPVELTALEFRLISYLLHHQGKVVSETELSEHIYGYDEDRDSNTIEVLINRLRRKLAPELIRTYRGQGYQLLDPKHAP